MNKADSQDRKYVFVCGLPRSGTSVLGRNIARMENCTGFRNTGVIEDEGRFLQNVYLTEDVFGGPGRFGFDPRAHLTESSALLTPENTAKLHASWHAYWDNSKTIFVEKTPANLLMTRFLQAAFPNSYFVVIKRHPIPVGMAVQKWKVNVTSLYTILEHWLYCHQLYEEDRKYLKHVYELSYEEYIQNPDKHHQEIARFIGTRVLEPPKQDGFRYVAQWGRPLGLRVPERTMEAVVGTHNQKYFDRWSKLFSNALFKRYYQYIAVKYEPQFAKHGYSLTKRLCINEEQLRDAENISPATGAFCCLMADACCLVVRLLTNSKASIRRRLRTRLPDSVKISMKQLLRPMKSRPSADASQAAHELQRADHSLGVECKGLPESGILHNARPIAHAAGIQDGCQGDDFHGKIGLSERKELTPEDVPEVSIIICTSNRAADLEATLLSFGEAKLPEGWKCEIVVVDNASIDDTSERARRVQLGEIETRVVFEQRKGKSYALNAGLESARHDIILFTDDDARPAAPNWIEQLAGPLWRKECDAVVGPILLAPHLNRPWLSQNYKSWLSCLEKPPTKWPLELIGSNMGFRRSVLQKIPAFDIDLGPGKLGLGEDTLFSWQLREAGFAIKFVEKAVVIHYVDPSRLRHRAWLKLAQSQGRKAAYLRYHWKHEDIAAPRLQLLLLRFKLFLRRIFHPFSLNTNEGCPWWEMGYVAGIAMFATFLTERKRPRNYSKRGLVTLKRSLRQDGQHRRSTTELTAMHN